MEATRRLTLRLFGVTAIVAVGSFWAQAAGLIGSNGIWPAAETMAHARAANVAFFDLPTLCWLSASDAMLHALCAAGVVAGLALLMPWRPWLALPVLWVSWLSLVSVGGPFLSFQWDVLLLETAASLMVLAWPNPRRWAWVLLAWLAFKVTFSSGVVKLVSGDPSWRDLTALTFHWWTQPLPATTSYLAAQWPLGLQQVLCLGMFVLELVLPVLAFGPRPGRLVAAGAMATLQVGLFLGGNYSYFNLLCLVLCVPLLDDRALAVLKLAKPPVETPEPPSPPRWKQISGWSVTGVVILLGLGQFGSRVGVPAPAPVAWVLERLDGFNTLNGYGAFAVMTKTRPEIVLEGSTDGVTFEAYELPWKPGAVDRRPSYVAPWQPRLDWQFWFAALGQCPQNPWMLRLELQLLRGSPEVEALFERRPAARPAVLRTRVFQYRFAPLAEAGVWWNRTEQGDYCPALTLGPDGNLRRFEGPPR